MSNVRRVAERRQWPIGRLEARLAVTEAQGRITAIDAELILDGALDEAQLASLREAAESCRISRALNVPVSLRLILG
jgi:organic hydroperoxide reductase OsmC/OhrA